MDKQSKTSHILQIGLENWLEQVEIPEEMGWHYFSCQDLPSLKEYMEEQEKVVDGIRGLILNIRNLNKIMSTNKVQELSEFEKVVENIKNFKISENETLQEWFKKEPERQKEIEDMQKTIISSLEVENF